MGVIILVASVARSRSRCIEVAILTEKDRGRLRLDSKDTNEHPNHDDVRGDGQVGGARDGSRVSSS